MKSTKTDIYQKKRTHEKQVVGKMIEIFCKGNKHGAEGLCEKCQELFTYASLRVDCCPLIETKTFCSNCPIHCYKADMRGRIKIVMRYSGPRMLFHHPILTIRYLIEERRDKGLKVKMCFETNKPKRTLPDDG